MIEDLVAIARLLFRSWRTAKVPQHKLRQLTLVGKQLCESLELGKAPVATQ